MSVLAPYATALAGLWLGYLLRGCTVPETIGIVDGPELRERVPWDAVVLAWAWLWLGILIGRLT